MVRQKYILICLCDAFGKDRHEPAPLLNKTLLDIGCGTCTISEELVFRGADVTALDINPQAIETAKKKASSLGAPMKFIETTPEQLVAQEESFDIILCLDVLEHAPDAKKLLWAAGKLLKPGGHLLFSIANRSWRSEIWHRWHPEVLPSPPRLTPGFTPTEFQKNLKREHLHVLATAGLSYAAKKETWQRSSSHALRYMGIAVKKD